MKMDIYDYPNPIDFKIESGIRSNTRRALSGKVWSTRVLGRDIITLTFGDLIKEDVDSMISFLYFVSSKGRFNDANKFTLHVERLASDELGSDKDAFRGVVRSSDESFQHTLSKTYSDSLSLTFEIISYEAFKT